MKKLITIIVLAVFLANSMLPGYAQGSAFSGAMADVSPAFRPPLLTGIKIDGTDPFSFNFILDAGDAEVAGPAMRDEAARLVRYFMASLAIPENDLWVNLSPYEKERIVPARAMVYEEGTKAVITQATLKVMLESDYMAMEHHGAGPAGKQVSSAAQEIAREVVRSVIIPVLEKEINEGRNFTQLRQVFYALILAKWYKENLKQSILMQGYADQKGVKGIEIADKRAKEKIYTRYLDAFKKGAFNYIKDEFDPASDEIVPRKYFSGGVNFLELNIDAAEKEPALDDAPGRQFDVKARFEVPAREDLPVERMKDWRLWREGNSQASHGTLYRNGDGTRILKILNKVRGVNDEHVREFYRTIQGLQEELKAYGYTGPVKVAVPELVRTDDGRLALRRVFKKGAVLQHLIDLRLSDIDGGSYRQFGQYPSNEEFRRITDEFLAAVDAVTGGKADRRTGKGFANFLLTEVPGDGYEIFNIDPLSVTAVVKAMAAQRRSLWASIKGALVRPKTPPVVIEGRGLPSVDMKDWKLWFWPNLRAGQSRIYISRDHRQVLKIFGVKGMREEHVREMHQIIADLPRQLREREYRGPVEVVVPRLVRVQDDGLGLLMEKKDGFMFEKTARRRLSVHDQKGLEVIAEDFFAHVDAVAGRDMADRRGVRSISISDDRVYYWNFIWDRDQDGRERIYNIDPIDMAVLIERAAGRRISAALKQVKGGGIKGLKNILLDILDKQSLFAVAEERFMESFDVRAMDRHKGDLLMILWDVVRRYGRVSLQRFGREQVLVVFKGRDIDDRPFTKKWILEVKEGPQASAVPDDEVARFIEHHFSSSAGGIDLNTEGMSLRTTGSGVHLDILPGPGAISAGAWEGMSPVIVSITPLEDARTFLAVP